MRNVLRSTCEVCHYWANKVQPSGRSSSVSFSGRDLLSYAATIARHYPEGVAFSCRTWSNTTSGHQSDARNAARHLKQVSVYDPTSVSDSFKYASGFIAGLAQKAATARQRRDFYLLEIKRVVSDFNTFAEWNGSEQRLAEPKLDDATLASIAKTKREVAKEEAKKAAARAAREALAAEELAKEWRQGEQLHWKVRNLSESLLRLKDGEIQTSHGASIPVADAHKLWPLIQRAKRGQREYEVGQPVGVYRLTKIRTDGSIVVGCHDIAYSEIEYIAKKLGLIKEGAAA